MTALNLDDVALSFIRDVENLKYMWESGLRKDHLLNPTAQDILEFAYNYWRDSGLQSAPTVAVVGVEFTDYTFIETEESLAWTINALKERYANNKTYSILEDAALAIQAGEKSTDTLGDVFKRSSLTIQNLTPRRSIANTATSVTDRRARYLSDIESGDIQGAPMGLDAVDDLVGGIRPGELAAVVGTAKGWKVVRVVE